ncbi:MAG: DUF6273 domain-containing protein [Oscillospiraceae bacterium]
MATLLGKKNVGDLVKIYEDGVAKWYRIVHKGKPSEIYDDSCDGVWLMRDRCFDTARRMNSSNNNDYANSEINEWLNDYCLSYYTPAIRESIKTVKIPYRPGNGTSNEVSSGADGMSCKVFLLSAYEVGLTSYSIADGTKLDYFESGTGETAVSKREGLNSTGVTVQVWLRSPSTYAGRFAFISESGNCGTVVYASNSTDCYVRPAFILSPNLMVDDNEFVLGNSVPEITSDTPNGTDLGEISDGFDLTYSVSDENSDPMTVSEYVDDTLTRSIDSPEGGEYTFGAVSGENWKTVLNGSHTLKIVVNDTKGDSTPYTVTFNKQVRTSTVSLAEPLPADDIIKAAAIAVTGHFPEDSSLTVLVTNNALDDSPVWEDMTASVMNSSNHVFTNTEASNGFAFNFKITATRGVSDEQGYISSIGGAFE